MPSPLVQLWATPCTLCMEYDDGCKENCDKVFPLIARLKAGPNEELAKLSIAECDSEVGVNVSAEVGGQEGGHSCNH